MILCAWLTSCIFAAPQTLVFRVLKHPQIEFFQCTSMDFFKDLLVFDAGDGRKVPSTFLWLGPDAWERIHSCIFLVAVYMVPLLVIIITYANILAKIVRKKRESSESSTDRQGLKNNKEKEKKRSAIFIIHLKAEKQLLTRLKLGFQSSQVLI